MSDNIYLSGSSPRVRGTHGRSRRCASSQRFIPACAGNTRTGAGRCHHRSVHPRVCGEHQTSTTDTIARRGSSPRVRGTQSQRLCTGLYGRFIPACAGNTHNKGRIRSQLTVHPRVCGEHEGCFGEVVEVFGSSPRVRGTQHGGDRVFGMGRFIPACAGNTLRPRPPRCSATVHPRVCGEHIVAESANRTICGSSPRVRGTRRAGGVFTSPPRFIPACAGNTAETSLAPRTSPVHPRVCGEHISCIRTSSGKNGSSPRVRGTQSTLAGGRPHERFIPACAGNTDLGVDVRPVAAVHPRVCGEHFSRLDALAFRAGSSPRVRGTRAGATQIAYPTRFIPACAGNTLQSAAISASRSVHPRVCGEHPAGRLGAVAGGGSSPRVRGTLEHLLPLARRRRFIPACAGNTSAVTQSARS